MYLDYNYEKIFFLKNHNNTGECIQLLSDSVAKIFNLVDKETERCLTYTNGCGLAMLIDALKVNQTRRIFLDLFHILSK